MRDKNIAIFEETLNICRCGSYKQSDKTVSLKLSYADMAQAIALSPDTSQRLMDDAVNNGTNRAFVMGRTGVYLKNSDSFEVAKDIIPSVHRDRDDSKSILVLNFANPVHPGGGVAGGARAQEEDLCRKSTLYISLLSDEARKMYDYNQAAGDYLATDYMVLSPNVEIFRDSQGALSEETYVVGVLTAAAPMVNRGNITATGEEIAELIRLRIRKMLYVAAHFGYKYLVLGAWGCGAFGNDADTVARLFYEELKAYKEKHHTLKDCFRRIAFAVLDQTPDRYNFKAFQKYFDNVYAEEEVAALTHGHELGWLSSGMAAYIINQVAYARVSVEDATRSAIGFVKENYSDRQHSEELVAIIEHALSLEKNGSDDAENIRILGEGWVAEETLAIAVYCSVKYQDDFTKALCVAVNHDGDSDSTGAVTGNILGAYHGYEKIPGRWKENLECADVIDEIALDLCHGRILSEYSTYKDFKWEAKYIYMNRVSRV